MRRLFLSLSFLTLFAPFLSAQELDVAQFTEAYKKAMRSLKTIAYSMELTSPKRSFTADIIIDRGRGYNDHRFLFRGTNIDEESGQQYSLGYSDDNDKFMSLLSTGASLMEMQGEAVRVYEDFGGALMSLNPMLVGLVVNGPFTKSTATGVIKDEHTVTFGGYEQTNGVECVVLDIKTSKGSKKYLIGKEDFLLREIRTDKAAVTYKIVETNEVYGADEFDLSLALGVSATKGGVLEVGSDMPDFNLSSMDGETVSLKDYTGQVVVIDFWGTWCAPCVKEIPELKKMATELATMDVAFLSVSCHEKKTEEAFNSFISEKGIDYTVLVKGESLAAKLNLDTYPSMVVVGEDGRILLTRGSNGSHDETSIQGVVEFIKARL